MTRARSAAITIVLASLATGCRGSKITPSECTALLDRYVEMSLRDDPETNGLTAAQATIVRDTKKEVKKRDASYRLRQKQCEDEVRRTQFDCAMAANNPNEWEACIQ